MDSPFTSLLHTNHIPSDYEVSQINSFLAEEPQAALSTLESEEQTLLQALEAVQQRKSTCKTLIEEHKALTSPLRRLPYDVLRIIFIYCLPRETFAVMSAEEAPMLLTHVCKRWRDAALTMPVLWSSLHVPIPACPRKPYRVTPTSNMAQHHPHFQSLQQLQQWATAVANSVGANGNIQLNLPGGMPIHPHPPPASTPTMPTLRPEELHIISQWNSIYENNLARWKARMSRRISAIDVWLSRSGNLKLSLNVVEWAPHPDRRSLATGWKSKLAPLKMQLINTLRNHKGRWERLELSVTWRFLAEMLGTEAPNLAYLKINHAPMAPSNIMETSQRFILHHPRASDLDDSDDEDEEDILVLTPDEDEEEEEGSESPAAAQLAAAQGMFNNSALIKSAQGHLQTLYLKALTTDIFQIPINWDNITELFFEGYSSRFSSWTPLPPTFATGHARFTKNEAAMLLAKTPRLKKCHLLIGRGERRITNAGAQAIINALAAKVMGEPKAPIRLEHLEHLSVHETNPREDESLVSFFEAFQFPGLKSVVFTTTAIPRAARSSSLLTLLNSAAEADIKRLAIDYRSFTKSDLERVLTHVSRSLEELWLTVDYWETRDGHWYYEEEVANWNGMGVGAINPNLNRPMPAFLMDDFIAKLTPKIPSEDSDMTGLGDDLEEVLLPNLTMLSCRLRTAEFEEDKLVEFIRARRHWGVLKAGRINKMVEHVRIRFAMQRVAPLLPEEQVQGRTHTWPDIHPYIYGQLKGDPLVCLGEESTPPPGYELPPPSFRNASGKAKAPLGHLPSRPPPLAVNVAWPPDSRITFFPRGFPDMPGGLDGTQTPGGINSNVPVHSRIWSPACGALGTTSIPGGGAGENRGVTDTGVRIF